MALSSRLRHRFGRAAALAVGALLVLPGPATAAVRAEPQPPHPRPAPPGDQLDGSGTRVHPLTGAPELPPELSARSWLVADVRSGDVLAAHDAHRRLPPASTLKSLFALTAMPQLDSTTEHRVRTADLAGMGEGSSLVGVAPDHSYRVADLWRGVFLSSGNDAVHVLSSMIGGTGSAVRQMQATAKRLGARDTHVVSPDGYDMPGQVSSAFDLAIFGRTGLSDPQFARYCSTAHAQFPGDHGDSYGIQNTNRLLTGAGGVDRYSGAVGVKNGYTTNAGHTLIAAAHRGNRTLLVTLMHPEGGPTKVYSEAAALLDWGFAADGQVRPVGSLLPPHSADPRPSQAPAAAAAVPADHSTLFGSRTTLTVAAGVVGALLLAAGILVSLRRRAAARGNGHHG
ncbi:D-alanyl-D-alanine carboxypeptidase family protein [Streptomyces sp. NPDC058045]|uniref:D-alanyl-D-alanine carboxypeptidase family protein n=1 Tax=Streptomyces sp. NPDC058045 TaxID=3346311 RepID=UPI0036E631BE